MVDIKKKTNTLPPVFDYEDFLHRIDNDIDLLKEVIEIFLEDTPGLLAGLFAAIEQGDPEAVEKAAHTLKGATANISARRMNLLSQEIQQSVKNNDLDCLDSFIPSFEENFEELEKELSQYLSQ